MVDLRGSQARSPGSRAREDPGPRNAPRLARSDADRVRAQGRPAVRGLDPTLAAGRAGGSPAPPCARGPSSSPCVASERANVRGSVSWTRPRARSATAGEGGGVVGDRDPDPKARGPPAWSGGWGRPRPNRQLSQPISFRACLLLGSAHAPAPPPPRPWRSFDAPVALVPGV